MSRLVLQLFGPPHIERDGKPVKVDRRKAIALVAYLAVTGKRHTRDALATLLWPTLGQSKARTMLRLALWTLRKAFGEEWFEADRESLALDRHTGLWLDVGRFHNLLATCRTHGHPRGEVCPACLPPLSEAVALYGDDFLAGFSLRDSLNFDDWQSLQSESLRRELSRALDRLVRMHSARGEFEPAMAHARRWLALDPLHEPVHCHLMQLYAQAGQQAAALRQYGECVQVLEEELGVPPQEETTRLYQTIKESKSPTSTTPELVVTPPHSLPLQPTPFIGREKELAEVERLLHDPTCRLLTLAGPGGVGKTRLALQAAAKMVGFSGGVHFVPLAATRSADLIVPAIADALSFSFHGTADPKAQLLNYLRHKEMLLVLDNYEHLLEGAGLVAQVLESAPAVKILITSRERLNLQWEWLFQVEGLAFPHNGETATIEDYDAGQLFLQRASRVRPGFALAEEEKPFVAHLCQFLEGLPLGIELAATWVGMFSCQEIAHKVESGLGFLATSLRDVPQRHRSLRAVFDHSWSLLSEEEQSAFRRLSVFRGGFREAAAERVTGASLPLLLALARKSFLRRDPATGRYDMLEVMRQYAEEKLEEAPHERDNTHDRHCAYYAEFLHQRQEHLKGGKQREALEEIGEEIENVRAAWEWAVERDKVEEISKALESLYHFYEMQGLLREGVEALGGAATGLGKTDEIAMTSEAGERGLLFGRILARQGAVCQRLSRYERAKELLEESLSILRHVGARQEMAFSFRVQGCIAYEMGEYEEAIRLIRESLAIFREIGDRRGMASCLANLGIAKKLLGEYEEAERLHQESLAFFEEIGDRDRIARCLGNLGNVAAMLGEYAEAKRLFQQGLRFFKEIDNRWGMAACLGNLGNVVDELGEHEQAIRLHQESLAIYKEIGDRGGISARLSSLGIDLYGLGEFRKAKEYFFEALTIAMDVLLADVALEALVGMVTILMEEGEKEQAVELVAHILHHPSTQLCVRGRAESLLSELEPQLDPQTFAAAQERGKARELEYYTRLYGPRRQGT